MEKPKIRYAKEMKEVLLDKNIADNEELYYMYRGVSQKGSARYDITEIPAKLIGEEYIKTKGHYHDDFREIYNVLEGEAIFLMQKGRDKIEDVYFVRAKKGEFILIPFDYGHITINPSSSNLRLGNYVCFESGHDYDSILNKKGGAYFYTTKGWIKNENYSYVPQIREEKPLLKIEGDIEEICLKRKE